MSDKLDMIYDLLKSDREDASEFRKEVRESHKDTGTRLGSLEASSQVQNQQIAEHISGVQTLKELHKSNVTKIEANKSSIVELEKPRIVRRTIKKWIIGLGACTAAILSIAKFIGMF